MTMLLKVAGAFIGFWIAFGITIYTAAFSICATLATLDWLTGAVFGRAGCI